MPQLIPFYFSGQILFSFFVLVALIIVLSIFILPTNTYLNSVRQYIDRISSGS